MYTPSLSWFTQPYLGGSGSRQPIAVIYIRSHVYDTFIAGYHFSEAPKNGKDIHRELSDTGSNVGGVSKFANNIIIVVVLGRQS